MRLDETLSTTMGNKLIELFKNDEKAFHILYAVSSTRKTRLRSIFKMALRNELFLIYMECLIPMDENRSGCKSTPDTNFIELVKRITKIQSSMSENEFRLEAACLIALEFTAQTCIIRIKSYLGSFEFNTGEIESVFMIAFGDLKEHGKQFVFAIDEASAAAKLFYPYFISGHNGNKYRGLLTPLVVFLYQFQAPAGTSFSLEYGSTIYSDIGKGSITNYLIDFEILTIEMIESYLELISHQLESKFGNIIEKENPYDNIDHHGWKNVMKILFVDCWFFGSYIPSHEINDWERHLIEADIAHLLENNKKSLAIDEPLSVDVVKK
ncbi:hypothetical protein C1645_828827 [Glomus cerebriforme]|uniref:Uncharacterized protein n=1 Tax=Glomus cerebriforme TaxID=658196 RepID=A0A397SM61_9GLOM|nr:hypothetical protein C1645_828827 [Glomus cerebriforme]